MNRLASAACLAVLACGAPARPPEPAKASAPEVEIGVEQRLLPAIRVRGEDTHFALADRMRKYRVPGVSIAVFDNYRIVWVKAYGVVDVAAPQPVTETTLFQAGSISKSVNALAVLTAVADGKLRLDVPVNELLHGWKLPDNELTRDTPVTLRRLLSHTAGTTVHGFPGYAPGAPVPGLVQVLDGTPPANTPPIRVDLKHGTQFRYSGGGISITQLALVENLGAAYPAILRDRVLQPLGMTDSTYEQPLPADRLPRAAAGHRPDGTGVPGKRHTYPEMAAAGLWTTPTDLAKFFLEVAAARAGRSTRISREIALQMTTEVEHESHVGLGVFMTTHNGVTMFGHDGADEGFQAFAIASLEGGYGLVMMVNSDNGVRLFPEVKRAVAAAMHWPGADEPVVRIALTVEQRARLVGRFTGVRGRLFEIAAVGDKLVAKLPFLPASELVPIAPNVLVQPDDGLRLTLGDDGTPIDLTPPEGPPGKLARIDAAAHVPLFELAAGHHAEAVAAWQAAVRADPRSPLVDENLHNRYAYELMGDGNLAAAIEVFRAISEVFPDSSNAYDSLGEAEMAAGHTPAAITAYEAAAGKLEADPRIPTDEKRSRREHAQNQLAILRAR